MIKSILANSVKYGRLWLPYNKINYFYHQNVSCSLSKMSTSSNQPKKIILTPLAPSPIGPYSQAISVGNIVYVSGQLGVNVRTGQMVTESIRAQAEQAFTNLKAVVEASGVTLSNVAKITIFITNFDDFPTINEVMKEYFMAPFPARSTIGVASLPLGAKVELEAIVHLNQ